MPLKSINCPWRQSFFRFVRGRRGTTFQKRCIHLSYTVVPAVGENQKKPTLVVAHGLFGANQNWRTISKKLNQICGNQIVCVDLRNHGDSEHHGSMTLKEMGNDIFDVIQRRKLGRVSLLGHSLGAKVMMSMALEDPSCVDQVISVDCSPVRYKGQQQESILAYINAMQSVDLSMLTSRKEAEPLLKHVVKSDIVMQFLLRNIIHSDSGLRWRMNLAAIAENYDQIMDFPGYEGKVFNGPTLFIGGAESGYITEKHTPAIKSYFPQAKVTHVAGAGHWVHSERPQEVVRLVSEFLRGPE